jgi:branched-subunit amino acid transport protein
MSDFEIWITIIGLTAVTIITRNFFLIPGDALRLPPRVEHALRYAPVCALTALVTPELFTVHGTLALSLANPKLIGGLVAAVTIVVTGRTLLTMALGMVAFWIARAWL